MRSILWVGLMLVGCAGDLADPWAGEFQGALICDGTDGTGAPVHTDNSQRMIVERSATRMELTTIAVCPLRISVYSARNGTVQPASCHAVGQDGVAADITVSGGTAGLDGGGERLFLTYSVDLVRPTDSATVNCEFMGNRAF